MASHDSEKISHNESSQTANPRRWSRNFSANRRRELDRLNRIEHRRQLLESRRQNDLFDQMSFTVNNLKIDSSHTDISNGSTATIRAGSNSNLIDGTFDHCQIGTDNVERLPSRKRDQQSDELEPNRTLTPEGESIVPSNKLSALDVLAQKINSVEKVTVLACEERGQEPTNTDRSKHTPETRSNPDAEHSRFTNEQLIGFISACVPKNKRVLCLIVRDKISKLNQAKSYFYPTYYLFIQAIIDIDDRVAIEPMISLNVTDDDLAASDTKILAEGSFSASSSISADMMFIGTQASSSAVVNSQKLSGNSYSDTEICDDTENEDGDEPKHRACTVQTPDLNEKISPEVTGGDLVNNDLIVHPERVLDSKSAVCEKGIADQVMNVPNLSGRPCQTEELEDDDEGSDAGENQELRKHYESSNNRISSDSSQTRGHLGDHSDQQFISSLFDNNRNPFTGTYGVVLSGRKRKKAKTYLIGPTEQGHTRRNCICKLKSNVLGTQFNAIRSNHAGPDDRCIIVSINYETNVLGFKGPRKMRVFLAKDENLTIGSKNLSELYKRDPSSVVQLKNMTPSWNVESQSYVLNFHGRVTQASVKNFQLVECEDEHHIAIENQRLLASRQQGQQQLEASNSSGSTKATCSNERPFETTAAGTTSLNGTGHLLYAPGGGSQLKANQTTLLQHQLHLKRYQQQQQQQQSHLSLIVGNTQHNPGATAGDNKKDESARSSLNVLIDGGNYGDSTDCSIGDPTKNRRREFQSSAATSGQQANGRSVNAEQNNSDVTAANAAVMSQQLQQQQQSVSYMDEIVAGSSHKSLLAYESSIVMQFGRISSHEFTCDVTYPLSILQAFSIALSSFDSKLACE